MQHRGAMPSFLDCSAAGATHHFTPMESSLLSTLHHVPGCEATVRYLMRGWAQDTAAEPLVQPWLPTSGLME